MSVRSSILAVLTLGPAYGLQLHSEIETRTCRSGAINVGQIYSTLNRLLDAGLVATESQTADRLPLYELTGAGLTEARAWLAATSVGTPEWNDMVQHVLLAASLPGVDLERLLDAYGALWIAVEHPGSVSAGSVADELRGGAAALDARVLRDAADALQANAALAWLIDVRTRRQDGALAPRGLSSSRPKRGRRPAETV